LHMIIRSRLHTGCNVRRCAVAQPFFPARDFVPLRGGTMADMDVQPCL
jgi:hypothetical protein